MSSIQDMIQSSIGDGARPAKFDVQVLLPLSTLYPDVQALTVSAKTSSFPGKQHEIIGLKSKGRNIPIRGQVKYTQSWDVTFYLTEDHSLKIAFEKWIEAIDQQHNYDHTGALGVVELQNFFANSSTNYVMPIIVTQLDFNLDEARTVYTLQNCFPVSVGPIEVSSESVGTISEFTVTFALSHYLVNAVAYDNKNIEEWKVNTNSLLSTSINTLQQSLAGGFNLNNIVNNALYSVTSQITGASQTAVSGLISSLF